MSQLASIDALAFGFPCNDYSVVGEQKGMNGTFGPLYSYGVKALKLFKPMWFLAENVGGLRSANEGKALKKILNELRGAGYTITPHLYKFEDYGIPQARHRLIIVGIRNDIDVEFKVPSPEPYANLDNTCRNAIENPPIPANAFNNERTKQSKQVIERLKHIKPGQNAFTANLPEDLQLNIKGAKISQIYKRLDPTKPFLHSNWQWWWWHSYLPLVRTTSTHKPRCVHVFKHFLIHMNLSVQKKVCVNKLAWQVPCQGAKIIFEAILKSFAGIEYESIQPSITE